MNKNDLTGKMRLVSDDTPHKYHNSTNNSTDNGNDFKLFSEFRYFARDFYQYGSLLVFLGAIFFGVVFFIYSLIQCLR